MVPFYEPVDMDLGVMVFRWLSKPQRNVLCQRSRVQAVLPLPPRVFFDNAPSSLKGLPDSVRALLEADVSEAGHVPDPAKAALFEQLTAPVPFRAIFERALSTLGPGAAPGDDFISPKMVMALPPALRHQLSEYIPLASPLRRPL